MSGLPGRSFRWRRKRNPLACRRRRTAISGLVFPERIRAISARLFGSISTAEFQISYQLATPTHSYERVGNSAMPSSPGDPVETAGRADLTQDEQDFVRSMQALRQSGEAAEAVL